MWAIKKTRFWGWNTAQFCGDGNKPFYIRIPVNPPVQGNFCLFGQRGSQRESIIFQPSMFRGNLLVLGRVNPWACLWPGSWVVVSNISYFHPYLAKWSNLTNIFKWVGFNHQLDSCWTTQVVWWVLVAPIHFPWLASHNWDLPRFCAPLRVTRFQNKNTGVKNRYILKKVSAIYVS